MKSLRISPFSLISVATFMFLAAGYAQPARAQIVRQLWADKDDFDGAQVSIGFIRIARDPDGNLIMCATTGDAKPAIVKYSPSGIRLWECFPEVPNDSQVGLNSMAVDSTGSVIVVGSTSDENSGGFVCKCDRDGNVLWTKYLQPDVDDEFESVAVDSGGNILVAGWGDTNSSILGLLVKFAPDGTLIWEQSDHAPFYQVAVDTTGNVYAAGDTFTPGGSLGCYKYDSQGNLIWSRAAMIDSAYAAATYLALDASGNVYVAGNGIRFEGGIYYEDNTFYTAAKFDPSGDELWGTAYIYPGLTQDFVTSIATDVQGNAYVTGFSGGFETATLKIDTGGNIAWVNRYGPSLVDWYPALAPTVIADPTGGVVVATNFQITGYVSDFAAVKYDDAGKLLWSQTTPEVGGSLDLPGDLIADPSGNIYVTGIIWDNTGTSSLQTVKYGPNQAPVASATSNSPVTVPHDHDPATNTAVISLDGSASSDPENDSLTYQWKEGSNILGTSPTLGVSKPSGDYTFTLTVTDTYGASSSKDVAVHVNAEPNNPPTLTVPATAAVNIGSPVTVQATATDPENDALTFSKASGPTWATVSASGAITLNPSTGTAGNFTVGVKVTDPYGASDQKNMTVNISILTTLMVSNSSCIGTGTCVLYARLYKGSALVQNSWLAGQSLTFLVNGTPIGTTTTDTYGKAYVNYVPLNPGTFNLTVQFGGSAVYRASSGTGTLTVLPSTAAVLVNPASGQAGSSVQLTGTLMESAGYGLAGLPVVVAVDGTVVATVTTARYGKFSCGYLIPSNASVGGHTITVSFLGDTLDGLSSGSSTLTVGP